MATVTTQRCRRASARAQVIVLVALGVLLGACTAEDEAGTAPVEPRPTEAATVVDAEPELLAAWSHDPAPGDVELAVDLPQSGPVEAEASTPAGVRVQVNGIRFDGDIVELEVIGTNEQGEDMDVVLAGGLAGTSRGRGLELTDDVGTRYFYAPNEEDDDLVVPDGEAIEARLRFFGTPPREASVLTLRTNAGQVDDGQDFATSSPVLTVDIPVHWGEQADGPGFRQATHPGRVALRAVAVEAAADHTVVLVEGGGRHALDIDMVLDDAGIVLYDDLDGRYPMVPGRAMALEPARLHEGRWVFAGALDPSASELSVVTNEQYAGGRVGEDPRSGRPSLSLEGIPVPDRDVLVARHPAGVSVAVTGVAVHSDRVAIRFVAVNGSDAQVLLDDGGIGLAIDGGPLQGVERGEDRDGLPVDALERVSGTLVFPADLDAVPDELRLVFNAGIDDRSPGDPIDDRTPIPQIEIDVPVAPPSFAGDELWPEADAERSTTSAERLEESTLTVRDVVRSDAERLERILFDLHAEAAPDGILITFPDDVLFAFDRDDLSAEGERLLEEMAEVIAYYGDAPVRVHGHTDSRGTPEYNLDLSQRRAETVVAHLAEVHGVDVGRMEAHGFGLEQPRAENTNPDGSDNPEGRARNRRVEVLILTPDRSLLPEG